MIDSQAIVHPDAVIGENVTIGPFSVIGAGVVIGDNNWIGSNVVIKGPTTIGSGNKFFQFSSIGEECQDKKYAGEATRLEIGDNNVFRECCTVHRGTIQDEGLTKIGSGNLFMAYTHVAHDCVVGDNVILANNASIAGHVHVGDHAILGGMTGVHQFVKIGAHAFTAGCSLVLQDVPPYVMASGQSAVPRGINSEGLKRRGFSKEAVSAIRKAYKLLYRSSLTTVEALPQLRELAEEHDEVAFLADFVEQSSRGIVR
ncbi:acyl-ACP--UDP-N-acetylglucosamine O-acyltransferase [Ferrimonas aestuarii]|uniref:Acyl-[acyl-carrier-protein]--UDP-N-acetylglucosamine O-acyltransferase n=1 Tax=Ferrimonas aestuarii TaxID=2569539 RepID=A0A4V5NVK2_9GAMM|nr:acyl-ACP--UDP-N-acetylglucosamine O-acyltransferase [Ferrimonas aestuarii]TKB50809.1 acyl-ACP--UDP-N-acetylglucosamine O-acyltransferase [Ferrimonas aestuarii]